VAEPTWQGRAPPVLNISFCVSQGRQRHKRNPAPHIGADAVFFVGSPKNRIVTVQGASLCRFDGRTRPELIRQLLTKMAEKMAAHLTEIPLTIEATKNSPAEQKPIDPSVGACVCGEPYTGKCMLASFGAQVRQLLIDLASSGNSAAAGARTSRKYGPGRSFGLLRSIWVDSWVHRKGYSGLKGRPKRSLINELLLSRTPTVEVTFLLKHFRARRNPFLLFSVITVQKSLETGAVCASPTVKLENPSFLARVVFVEDSKTERPFFIRAVPKPETCSRFSNRLPGQGQTRRKSSDFAWV
jgi:hypothetical protein